MIGTAEKYTLSQAARILGVSRAYLTYRFVETNEIPWRKNPLHGRPEIMRSDLVRFMVDHGYPPEMYRGQFSPKKGLLFWLGRASDIDFTKVIKCDPRFVPSVLSLGRQLSSDPCWGIVLDYKVNLSSVVRDVAHQIGKMLDGPLLIALTCNTAQTKASIKLFDLVIPRPFASSAALGAALYKLRESRVTIPRKASLRGERFYRAGK